MIIGRMDKRVSLYKPVTEADQGGGRKTTWQFVGRAWAELRRPKTSLINEAGAVVSVLTQEIMIRYRDDVARGWRVKYNDRVFEIIHPPYDYNRADMILICREVVR